MKGEGEGRREVEEGGTEGRIRGRRIIEWDL